MMTLLVAFKIWLGFGKVYLDWKGIVKGGKRYRGTNISVIKRGNLFVNV